MRKSKLFSLQEQSDILNHSCQVRLSLIIFSSSYML